MAVHVGELSSTVETEVPPTTPPPSSGAPDDAAQATREQLRRLRRDEARTAARDADD